MLTGRKLLLADDSVAIQKVIDLTFSDEGMQVTTVGDGRQALDRLEEIAPDIVLADVFMPGIDGYELCRIIRGTEQFKQIPVLLLVGSFEPFNEAEARRVGANDVVTKPFQSIRDLVSRVGSLLGNKAVNEEPAHEYSTLGLGRIGETEPGAADSSPMTEPVAKVMVEAPAAISESMQDTNVTVMVEAASMPDHESPSVMKASCAADVEMQTANTGKLERIDDDDFGATTEPGLYAQDDTIEIEPALEVASLSADAAAVAQSTQPVAPPKAAADVFSDALLDLGDFSSPPRAVTEDVILDLDFEESAAAPPPAPVVESKAQPAAAFAGAPTAAVVSAEPTGAIVPAHDWAIVSKAPEAPAESAATVAQVEEKSAAAIDQAVGDQAIGLKDLSPELIDAIARRAVEHLSDKVVREIAWEVVPELAELLIKQRLDEEK